MSLRLAIIGLDAQQRPWLEAVEALRAAGEVELVAVGHRSLAAAKDVAGGFKGSAEGGSPAVFDDLRLLLKERTPQIILLDRPPNLTLEFLLACVAQEIGVFSLGPPVESPAEAQALAAALPACTHLFHSWPRFIDSPAYQHFAAAPEFVRPIRFVQASWLDVNYALARTLAERGAAPLALPVRSLSVLAWDALATLIDVLHVPASVYATIRGTVGPASTLADLSGAAALTLLFPDDVAAGMTLCDRVPLEAGDARVLLLWGQGGMVRLTSRSYELRSAEGKVIDAGTVDRATPRDEALQALRRFIGQFQQPPSPHRGWPHRLDEIAAAMEAMLVSHRTGQAESPDRFRRLRR